MKKILFPTDFSEPSKNAFRYALLLADHMEASIKVIHATLPTDDIEVYGRHDFSTELLLKDLKKEADSFVDLGITQVLPQLKNPPVISTQILLGTPIRTITKLVEEEKISLILMGSRGNNRSRLDRVLGSFAAGVVEKSIIPVIIIPENITFKPVKTIAYASDLVDTDPFEIWKVINLWGPSISSVDIIHIKLENEDAEKLEYRMKEMDMFFADRFKDMEFNFHIVSGLSVQKELDRFTEKYQPDMMVMYQPLHTFWDKLFFKSYTKERTVLTQIPLLVQKAG